MAGQISIGTKYPKMFPCTQPLRTIKRWDWDESLSESKFCSSEHGASGFSSSVYL